MKRKNQIMLQLSGIISLLENHLQKKHLPLAGMSKVLNPAN